MQEFTPLDPPERELEQALASLQLKTIAETEIWYQAGLKTGRRLATTWQVAAAAIGVLAMVTAVWRPKPAPVMIDRIVYVPTAPQSATIASANESNSMPLSTAPYFQLRDAIERGGLSALPAAGGSGVLNQPVVHAWSTTLSTESQISGDSL